MVRMDKRLSYLIARMALIISSALLVMDLSMLTYGVVSRYLFGSSPFWLAELARFLIIGTALIAAGAVWIEGMHMRVGIVERIVPRPLAMTLYAYQWALTLSLAAFGTWISWNYAWSVSGFSTMGLGISRTLPLLAVPAGFGLLFIHALLRGPRPLPDIADLEEQQPEQSS